LYHLVSGFTSKDIKKYVPYSSYYAVYKQFWITNHAELNNYVNYYLKNMFSNVKIGVSSSLIKNPWYFKNITLILDGHDSSLEYNKPDISLQKKWSYKLRNVQE
jgi:hypothetical protein